MTVQSAIASKLLKPAEVAELAGIPVATLTNLREKGKGPRYLRINEKCVRYTPADIDAWLQSIGEGGPEKHHGNQKTSGNLALSVPMARPHLLRNNRLGGHRTKSQSSEGSGSPRTREA